MREFTVPFCGSDNLGLNVKVSIKGNKDLLLYLVEPSGAVTRYDRNNTNTIVASLDGPLETGDWTARLWNLSKGKARAEVTIDFK